MNLKYLRRNQQMRLKKINYYINKKIRAEAEIAILSINYEYFVNMSFDFLSEGKALSLLDMDTKEDLGKRINALNTEIQFIELQLAHTRLFTERLYEMN